MRLFVLCLVLTSAITTDAVRSDALFTSKQFKEMIPQHPYPNTCWVRGTRCNDASKDQCCSRGCSSNNENYGYCY